MWSVFGRAPKYFRDDNVIQPTASLSATRCSYWTHTSGIAWSVGVALDAAPALPRLLLSRLRAGVCKVNVISRPEQFYQGLTRRTRIKG